MLKEPSLNPPGMQAFLSKLARVDGNISVKAGIVTFPDGTTADLNVFQASGLSTCWHCGALMNHAQRYICGCPKCIESDAVMRTSGCC